MADLLSGYLSAAGRRSWAWGQCDCILFCADWVRLCSGLDPAGTFRGSYATQRQARGLIKRAGGIEAIIEQGFAASGLALRQITNLVPGDVGLVRVAKMFRCGRPVFVSCGAICVRPDLWAIKTADGPGLVVQPFPLIRAWGLPNA